MIYYPNYNKKNLHNFILNLFFHTIILSRSIYDKKGLHWCWNTNKIPLNQSVISQKTRIENDSKKTRTRVQANKRNGKAGRRGEGRDAYCKKAKWMSIGTVWEKSWVTVYKRHNATRSRLYVPNGSNRKPSFAISSRTLRSFSFFHFPSLPIPSPPRRSTVKVHTWPHHLSPSRVPRARSMQETAREWRSKRSLRLLFTSER